MLDEHKGDGFDFLVDLEENRNKLTHVIEALGDHISDLESYRNMLSDIEDVFAGEIIRRQINGIKK